MTSSSREPQDAVGMRGMFWTWTAIIAVGLFTMIAVPLSGR